MPKQGLYTNSSLSKVLILLEPGKSMQRDTEEIKTIKYVMCIALSIVFIFLCS